MRTLIHVNRRDRRELRATTMYYIHMTIDIIQSLFVLIIMLASQQLDTS